MRVTWFGQLPIVGRYVIPVCIGFTLVTVAVLWWHRGRRLRFRTKVTVLAISLAVAVLAAVIVDHLWRPFADPVGWGTWLWLVPITLASMLLFARPRRKPAPGTVEIGTREGGSSRARRPGESPLLRAVAVGSDLVAVGIVVMAATLAINANFAAYPTVGDLFGITETTLSLNDLQVAASQAPSGDGAATLGARLAAEYPSLVGRSTGLIATVDIPPTASGFRARTANVYLPPAAIAANPPTLPVLVLLAGQPGGPEDWVRMGNLEHTMDTFASAHGGRAPVVVVPDPLGSAVSNPLCSDTSHGKVATYLQEDIAGWINANFGVAPQPGYRAIGGISNGATCALQVGAREPRQWPVVIDLAGELHPDLGGLRRTIADGFDGDQRLYEANDPVTLLQQSTAAGDGKYARSHVFFGVGSEDRDSVAAAATLSEATKAAGMDTVLIHAAGRHAWQTWASLLPGALDWYAGIFGAPD